MVENATKTLKLIGYCRVSTEDQRVKGVSLRAYATAQEFEVVRIAEDRDVSGRIHPGKRPGLQQALSEVRRGEADGIVVLKLDRLSRVTRDVLDLVDSCQREDWRLVSVTESLDTGTASGKFVLTILAAISELERGQVAERTRIALEQIAIEGRARSRWLPFGYRTKANPRSIEAVAGDRSRLLPYEPEQRILRRMMELRRQGKGPRRIARVLNEAGLKHPRTGRIWSFNLVQGILRSAERRESLLASAA